MKQGLAENSEMLALPLQGFSGLIGTKEFDADGAQMPRLGRELAGAAKLAGVAEYTILMNYLLMESNKNLLMQQGMHWMDATHSFYV